MFLLKASCTYWEHKYIAACFCLGLFTYKVLLLINVYNGGEYRSDCFIFWCHLTTLGLILSDLVGIPVFSVYIMIYNFLVSKTCQQEATLQALHCNHRGHKGRGQSSNLWRLLFRYVMLWLFTFLPCPLPFYVCCTMYFCSACLFFSVRLQISTWTKLFINKLLSWHLRHVSL